MTIFTVTLRLYKVIFKIRLSLKKYFQAIIKQLVAAFEQVWHNNIKDKYDKVNIITNRGGKWTKKNNCSKYEANRRPWTTKNIMSKLIGFYELRPENLWTFQSKTIGLRVQCNEVSWHFSHFVEFVPIFSSLFLVKNLLRTHFT